MVTRQTQKPQAGAPRKGDEPNPESGPIVDVPNTDPPRVKMTGDCLTAAPGRGDYTVISQTNGQAETIRYPKNVGQCGALTILCLDNIGRPIPGTDVTLAKGHSLRQFSSSGARAHSVVFYCTKEGDGGACEIEFDR